MPVPVSTPKSPLLMNGDVTINVLSQARQPESQEGALPGPQMPPILKRSTTSFNSPANHFEVFIILYCNILQSKNILTSTYFVYL